MIEVPALISVSVDTSSGEDAEVAFLLMLKIKIIFRLEVLYQNQIIFQDFFFLPTVGYQAH